MGITHSTQSTKADTGAGKWDTGRVGEREPVVWGSKKEEFEHLESIIRNEKKIQRQHKKDRFEQEYDPRKECLRSYADLYVFTHVFRFSCLSARLLLMPDHAECLCALPVTGV
jgi:hypothetical protein